MFRSTLVHITSVFAIWPMAMAVPAFAFDIVEPDQPPPDVEVLGDAEPVSPDLWPATVTFRTDDGGCTATFVGPQVLVTAAHCVQNNEIGQGRVKGRDVTVRCEHHPSYARGNPTTDFALCIVTMGDTQGIPFESVGTAIAHPRKGEQVTLLGYGCLKEGGVDKTYGILHVGTATVSRQPDGSENIDTIVKGGAALCYGDSGGAAYFFDRDNARSIVGINSRGDISTTSYLSTTATPQFVGWAVDWSEHSNVTICGLHVDAAGCR